MSNGSLKYFFSIRSTLESTSVGPSPSGQRVDIQYEDERGTGSPPWGVYTQLDQYLLAWAGQPDDAPTLNWTHPRFAGSAPQHRRHQQFWSTLGGVLEHERQEQSVHARRWLQDHYDANWYGICGFVRSGSDWATVRDDNVIEFDGNLALHTDDGLLLDVVTSGTVDLAPMSSDVPDDSGGQRKSYSRSSNFVSAWKSATVPQPCIRIVFAVSFRAAHGAPRWAPKRYERRDEVFAKYERLTRGQFVAMGTAKLGKSLNENPIERFDLDVLEVVGP